MGEAPSLFGMFGILWYEMVCLYDMVQYGRGSFFVWYVMVRNGMLSLVSKVWL